MAKRNPHPNQSPDELYRRVHLDDPGRAGGLAEFIHALAAILARLDAEQHHPVQSDPPQNAADRHKEEL
jgi:hypothetical protein